MNLADRYIAKRGGSACCQGCGRLVYGSDACDLEYVKTKRGTEFVFHKSCADKVWKAGIK